MPTSQQDWGLQLGNHKIGEHLYDCNSERNLLGEWLPLLNLEQMWVYNQVVDSVEDQAGCVFFLNGPGGTGKTFVYKTVCNKLCSDGMIALCVASSGIAALLLSGGCTFHSLFKIPVKNLMDESYCTVPKDSARAGPFRVAWVIIWDEAAMQHQHAPKAVNHTLHDIREDECPFGGLTVVFGGDFQQILPVVPNGSCEDIVNASIQCLYLWDFMTVLHLHQNMHLEEHPTAAAFAHWLLDVGHGHNTTDDV